MTGTNSRTFDRRSVLRAGTGLPLGVLLASCASGGGSQTSDADDGEATGPVDPDNPFGVSAESAVEAVIFNGGYNVDYVEFAAEVMAEGFPDVTVDIAPATHLAQEMQPRFVAGDPPDLIQNSGANSIGMIQILDQLADLDDIVDAPNLEGETIRDTLYEGTLDSGVYDDRLLAINYVVTVYGLWYSKTLFDEHGWQPPVTWDDLAELGRLAQEEDLYLFCWGQESATYYQTLVIDSAIKEGGDEVRLPLENLEDGCWSHPAVQGVMTALKEIIDAGGFLPGGTGTHFTAAQAQWSQEQQALLYPAGSWIENEMREHTVDGFEMTGTPTPSLTADGAYPAAGIHSTPEVPLLVPADGANVAGGKELIRTMLSQEAAANFAAEKLAPTVVAGTVPEDGFGSTALASQTRMIEAAGSDVYTWSFVQRYGLNQEHLPIWNSFLDGRSTVAQLTEDLQTITDRVREDDAVEKIPVT
ncbi:N-acetylglucosamine/diacetylchitobiose ABC transporter substrate-binding protein [Ruania zhangjianzhongii]|uniref:N-acetylglucosamine/diacetylchitobiose ABC transporter substrate-binding protein n=1 Tax=Ruania zhangjianzhongii TaxID=2603206 RepID=UPI0011C923CE|nr:N-acetylglucosamine/diacetylchitobiose ABC transporter substrate-binding protein [Ruania zhangjianzhongii]